MSSDYNYDDLEEVLLTEVQMEKTAEQKLQESFEKVNQKCDIIIEKLKQREKQKS